MQTSRGKTMSLMGQLGDALLVGAGERFDGPRSGPAASGGVRSGRPSRVRVRVWLRPSAGFGWRQSRGVRRRVLGTYAVRMHA
jgi:hypothetical protein